MKGVLRGEMRSSINLVFVLKQSVPQAAQQRPSLPLRPPVRHQNPLSPQQSHIKTEDPKKQ